MKPAKKSRIQAKKNKIGGKVKKFAAPKPGAKKNIAKPVPKKPQAKIAAKVRSKILNAKEVESAVARKESAPMPVPIPAKTKPRTGAQEAEFEIKKTKIRIIGIGGGGGNIVSEIAGKVKKSSFIIANTDAAALRRAPDNVSVFQFGDSFTRGLGTGMDPRVAEEAAVQDKEKIKKMMEGQDLVIIVASLGGGAGSGAVPIFAQISKSLGNLTYGIFTLPFDFEGQKKSEIAKNALEKSKPHLNALTILPNERVFEVVPKATPFSKTLSYVNNALSGSLEGLIETIYGTGMINIDFADLRAILMGSGKMAFLNTVVLKNGDEGGADIFEKVFSSPLYPYGIDKARGLLLNIVAQKDLKLLEVNKILTGAADRIHKDARIIFGVSNESARENSVKVTVLATGCVYAGISNGDENGRETSVAVPLPARSAPPAPARKSEQKVSTAEKRAKPVAIKKTKPFRDAKKKKSVQRREKEIVVKVKSAPLEQKLPAVPQNDSEKVESLKKDLDGYQTKQSIDAQFEAPARKNALQVKKEIEMEERAILEQEKAWEIPAFLRKQNKN